MRNIVKYGILAVLIINLSSCVKLVEPTQTDLAVGLWRASDVFINRENQTNFVSMTRLELERNGSYLMVQADSRASGGTWELSEDSGTLTLTDDNGEEVIVFTVNSLTRERLHMFRVIGSDIAGDIEVRYRMEKQFGGTY
jgi:hypothetical protein